MAIKDSRGWTYYMDTAPRRPAAHLAPMLVGVFSREVSVCDVWAAMDTQTSAVYQLYIVWSFRIPYRRWYFAYEWDRLSEITWQGFNGTLHYDNKEMYFFFLLQVLRKDGVMYTNYTSTSKCLGFSMCLFQVWGAYFFPQIWICSQLSLRLLALEKEAPSLSLFLSISACEINTTDGRTDRQAVLYFSLITGFYRVTLHWCNDLDVWNSK